MIFVLPEMTLSEMLSDVSVSPNKKCEKRTTNM
jgi:hypothetical protein